jgi:hypothetical protein
MLYTTATSEFINSTKWLKIKGGPSVSLTE